VTSGLFVRVPTGLNIEHFIIVQELLFHAHGWVGTDGNLVLNQDSVNIANAQATFSASDEGTYNQPTASTLPPQPQAPQGYGSFNNSPAGGVRIVGTQHGPIPAWLVSAAAKVRCTKVFDNRDTATAENRRPLFKAADGDLNKEGKAVAFWAPKV